MNIRCIAGLFYFAALSVAGATPLDDKIKAFEEAVRTTPAVKLDPLGPMYRGRDVTVDDLETAHQLRNTDGESMIVSRVMAPHPSDAVRQAGEAVLHEMAVERADLEKAFATKAEGVLSETQDAITHAKTAADLDGILTSLKTLTTPDGGVSRDAGPDVANRVASTFQFATQWQNYLAAAGSGNWTEARNNLRTILDNPRIDAPDFFPRSEILARYEATFHDGAGAPAAAAAPTGQVITDPDEILKKIVKQVDLEANIPDLQKIAAPPGYQPWDWSEFIALAKAYDDSLAGLPVSIDLRKAMNWPDWGDQWSRITAMELLFLLPRYFGTDSSAPPKEGETLAAYLDRLTAQANTAGDLALLQRVLAVQVALSTPESGNVARPEWLPTAPEEFLAGLSQDAAGQYAAAVVSYETSLKNANPHLPVKIVGDRLAVIKAAHPEDFEKGLTTFLTPPAPATDPFGRPLGWPMPQPPPWQNQRQNPITIFPIPMTISTPARTSPPSTNSANPASPSHTK